MTHQFLPFRGYRTGRVEKVGNIRQSLAFDLTAIDFHGRTIVGAALHLPAIGAAGVWSLRLSDPANQMDYGAVHSSGSGETQVVFSTDALCDLREAAGGYFSVDAVVGDGIDVDELFSDSALESASLVIVAAPAVMAAAAA